MKRHQNISNTSQRINHKRIDMNKENGAEIKFPIVTPEDTPVLLSGADNELRLMFDGKLPEVGDTVGMVCYEVTEKDGKKSIKLKWKVEE